VPLFLEEMSNNQTVFDKMANQQKISYKNENSNNLRHIKNQKVVKVRQKFSTVGKLRLESSDNDSNNYLENEQIIDIEHISKFNNVKFLGYPQTNNSNQLRHVSKHKMANCNNRAIEIVSKLNLENDFETDMHNDCLYNSYANDS